MYAYAGMIAVQSLLLGLIRPKPDHPLRPKWRLAHAAWGQLSTLLGIANLFIGTALMHQSHVSDSPNDDSLLELALCA